MRFSTLIFLLASALIMDCLQPKAATAQTGGDSLFSEKELSIEALYIDAVKAGMLDNTREEEQLLRQVIKEKPDEAAPYYELARILFEQKNYREAETTIRKAVELAPENPWYKATYATILESANKTEAAARVYKELAASQKFNKEFLFNAARLYERAGKFKDAIELYDQLVAKVEDPEIVLLQEQQLYLKLNDLEKAVGIAQRLINQNPRDTRFIANLASLYENNGQEEKALKIYKQGLNEFPDDPNIQYGLAEYYKKLNDSTRYHEYIKKAILNPAFDDEVQISILFSYLQELAADTTQRQQTLAITKALAAQHPENPQVITLYGEVLLNNGEQEQANKAFKKAISLDPSRFVVWQRLLFNYTTAETADSLIVYSQKALRYFPNQAIVHYLNGVGHYNKKEYKAAAKALQRAIDLQPDDNPSLLSDMYALLGDIYNASENFAASDSNYEEAIRLNPQNATALNNYAYYLSVRGSRLADAEKMSKKSLEIRPDEPTFLDTYGWILFRRGEYQKAKELIEKALKLHPDADGTLYDHLGDAYYKLGQINEAVEYWKKAKEKGVDNKNIEKKIQGRKLYE